MHWESSTKYKALSYLWQYSPVSVSYTHLDVYKRQLLHMYHKYVAKWVDKTGLYCHRSVSYTHLDVYKRQREGRAVDVRKHCKGYYEKAIQEEEKSKHILRFAQGVQKSLVSA